MLKTITPIDNSIYVEREYASPKEIENTLIQSKKSFYNWRQTPLNERKTILTKFVDSFLQNNTEIEEELCRQLNLKPEKPIITLYPGSRNQEISRHFPILIQVAKKFNCRTNIDTIIKYWCDSYSTKNWYSKI